MQKSQSLIIKKEKFLSNFYQRFFYLRNLNDYFDLQDVMCLIQVILYLIICPFTKVEESFNLQAMHDILFYGKELQKYDHFEFPGVVPRTFVGAFVISIISYPLHYILQIMSFNKLSSQYLVRFVLGFILVIAMGRFRRQITNIFGKQVGISFTIISNCQFHLPFYMSRTLPNTFALAIVLFAYSFWLQNKWTHTIALFAFATTIFRSEVILLFIPLILEALVKKRIGFTKTLLNGILFGILSLVITISVDSYFWNRWLWPEGEVFWFNTYQNKSHQWGISPYYWYFFNAIPKVIMGCIAFLPFGIYFEPRLIEFCRPIIIFLILYSFLPHKELRFIFYVIPFFNLVAAVGLSRIYNNRKKNIYSTYILRINFFSYF